MDLLVNTLQATVIHGAPNPTTLFPPAQLSMNMLQHCEQPASLGMTFCVFPSLWSNRLLDIRLVSRLPHNVTVT